MSSKHIIICADCCYTADHEEFSNTPDTQQCPKCLADESRLWDAELSKPLVDIINSHDKLVELLEKSLEQFGDIFSKTDYVSPLEVEIREALAGLGEK